LTSEIESHVLSAGYIYTPTQRKRNYRTLRFVTADGHTILRNGYRLEDFVDDDIGGADVGDADASRDAFRQRQRRATSNERK
jgi:hypothetical protein